MTTKPKPEPDEIYQSMFDLAVTRAVLHARPVNLSDPQFRRSWIQVAKTGEFVSSRYGKFDITQTDLQQMVHNFTSVTPLAPTKLPVDYDHLSMSPQKPGDGKAAGWFTGKMELRDSGHTLWAEIEWTPPAANAIANREYQYVSPSFVKDYKHKDGRKLGTTLLAAAITNHPFLEGMAALHLSRTGEVALPAAPRGHRQTRGERPMNHMLKLADGSEVEIEQEAIEAIPFVADLMAKAAQVINASASGETLQQQIVSLTSAHEATEAKLAEATRQLRQRDAEAEVDTLNRTGKLIPAQRGWAINYYLSDQDGFTQWKETLVGAPAVELGKEHGSDGGKVADGDEAGKQLISLSETYAKEKGVTFAAAMNIIGAEHPELAEAYHSVHGGHVRNDEEA